jgi:hypothetical protein
MVTGWDRDECTPAAPVECIHGYPSDCPDCDTPAYLPAVLPAPVDTADDMRRRSFDYWRARDYGRAAAYGFLADIRRRYPSDNDYRLALAGAVADIHAAYAAGARGAYWPTANYRRTLEIALRRATRGR